MNAFDMISEPILFVQELREYSSRVRQCVELIQSLADALLAEDYATIRTLHEQMSGTWHDVNQSKLSLYDQIKGMHFHVAGGDAFNQYMACQDRVADSLQGLANLLALRKTPIPAELREDFRALVAAVVNISRRTMSLAEAAFSETETVCAYTQAQNVLDAIRGTVEDKGQTREHEMEFTRHLYSLEKQLDPVALMFLDKCSATLHEVADNAEHAADYLRLMIR
jgi:predicted phosphate transport protein (TIGR00153 family)